MLLEDVISNFPFVTADAVAIGYCPSEAADWEIVWVNDAFCGMFKAEQLDVLGRHPNYFHHKDYIADFQEHVQEMKSAGQSHLTIGTRCVCEDGEEFWASISLFIIPDPEGDGRHCVLNIRDINDLKDREQAAELALIENEQLLFKVEAAQTRLLSAIQTTGDPFAIYDRRFKLVIWNPAYSAIFTDDQDQLTKGMKMEAVMRLGAENGRFPNATGWIDDWIEQILKRSKESSAAEYRLTTTSGEFKVVLTQADNGDKVVLLVDISDFLEQQRELEKHAERLEHSNQEYSHQALHDELTGLANRRYLNLKLDELTEARRREGGEIAALHVDLDRFKQVNDTMGHAAGDHVLEEVSRCLKAAMREEDFVARTGGDEFVVLLPCEAHDDAPEQTASRLVEDLAAPVYFEDRLCSFGGSVGIARTPLVEPEELLTSSDIALYKAKTAGRGRVGVFDHSDLEDLHSAKNMVDQIIMGLERGEFRPIFQPEVDSASGAVVYLEVLARWYHPERGVLLPGDFLTTAEEAQLTALIDAAILKTAVEEVRSHCAKFEALPGLSFNISTSRLETPGILDDLARLGYPGDITLEISEPSILDDGSVGYHRNLEGLRHEGVKLLVDHFGSGSASILALRRLSPHRIKIDHRLVEPIIQSSSARQLVDTIVRTARTLGIGVTGTGVESAEQALALIQMGCDRLQGPHIAEPAKLALLLPSLRAAHPRQTA